jgi:uncharacterized repeat protein (TIGR01451 family)
MRKPRSITTSSISAWLLIASFAGMSVASAGEPSADISVIKTDSTDPVVVGDPLTYTLTVSNAGPDVSPNTFATDVLPAQMAFQSAVPSQGSCSQSSFVSCQLGSLASGASATVQIHVIPTSEGTIQNSGRAGGGGVSDPDGNNNQENENTVVQPRSADISLTKTDSPDPVEAGEELIYRLVVENAGPNEVTVHASDDLPQSVHYVSASSSQGSCIESDGQVSCDLGRVGVLGQATVDIVVVPAGSGTITNSAAATNAAGPDPDTTNNSDEAMTEVTSPPPSADLSVVKTDLTDPATQGQSFQYKMVVTNSGPNAVTQAQLVDNLPAAMTFDQATPDQGTCEHETGVVTCDLGALASGASTEVLVRVIPTQTGSHTNTATVSSEVDDPDSTDDSDGEATQVNAGTVVITVTESVGVADSPDVTPPETIAIIESVGVADSPDVTPPETIAIIESVEVADGPEVTPATALLEFLGLN